HSMTQRKLTGLRIAILATDGFEQSELTEPRKALDAAGAITEVVSPKEDEVRGWHHKEWGLRVPVDQDLAGADARDYDALVLPGGGRRTRLRRAGAAGGGDEPRRVAHAARGDRVREGLLPRRQAGGSNLPR